jgi:hypothetical protein
VAKKTADTKSKRRTKVKPMSKPPTELGSEKAKKVRGGNGTNRAPGGNDSIWVDLGYPARKI